MTIKLTNTASNHIKETIESLSKKDNTQIIGIKFGVKKTGCSGYAYTVDFLYQDQAQNNKNLNIKDCEVFQDNNINIYVANEDLQFINGMHVDYVQTGLGSVMVFDNPNAANECGCGESFSLKEKEE